MAKKLKLMALEPRVLLDAAGVVTAAEAQVNDAEQAEQYKQSQLDYAASSPATNSQTETHAPFSENSDANTADSGNWQLKNSDTTALQQVSDTGLVVVDTSIENYQALLNDLAPDAEVLLIDSEADGLAQIAAYVEGRADIDSIHILSHGDQGVLKLGTAELDAESLDQYSGVLNTIGQSLSDRGDILLYGCNVAEGEIGIDFVSELAQYTGADVAASSNLTGHSQYGGDWQLEYSAGAIDASPLVFGDYDGIFGFDTTTDHNGDAIGDPIRMITWNVIGMDSNRPETSGPNTFMVGFRVSADASGLSGYTAKIVEDNGVDIFGTGQPIGDSTTASGLDDGIDNIQFTGKGTTVGNLYTGIEIGANSYKDIYFNVEILRDSDSFGQIQPFHFEIFKDDGGTTGIAGNGIWDGDEDGQKIEKFSWLPDSAAANTRLYLIVEKLVSQGRNEVESQTTGDSDDFAVRIDGIYDETTNSYPNSSVTLFIGQTLNIRVEGATATQGYTPVTGWLRVHPC